ncbi:MAG: putative oxidoreductase C-terminal domain-containing protein [Fermentimonas sp.]
MKKMLMALAVSMLLFSCTGRGGDGKSQQSTFTGKAGEIKLIVLAPGHFHASLLQKSEMEQVNKQLYIYSETKDAGLAQYLSAIESFNAREVEPTHWESNVYMGSDYLERMLSDQKGNVVILAGNNRDKTEYILASIDAGFNVLSDKPMAINQGDFHLLEAAYENSVENGVFLYDMMTERYDMLNIIEKELVADVELFGELQKGTVDEPAVFMESTHHFFKTVAGSPLIRPAWYYDVEQQGEGIADVTTHLIDQLFWKCFPDQVIDYKNNEIADITAEHWPTEISLPQFTSSTNEVDFPDYLQKYLDGDLLKVYANGTLHFTVRGHHAGLKVLWNWEAPQGSGDTFKSVIRGTKATLRTEQGNEQGFVKQLYVQRPVGVEEGTFEASLKASIERLQAKYPFLSYEKMASGDTYLIHIPLENREGHETHFKYVAERYFKYLVERDMPDWEKTNTLTKYYITTKAVEVAGATR